MLTMLKTRCSYLLSISFFLTSSLIGFVPHQALPIINSAAEFDQLYPALSSDLDFSPDKTYLFVMRHGETDSNVARGIAGRTLDVEINAKGQAQALETASLLTSIISSAAGIYSSPMKRTLQTSEILKSTWEQMYADQNLFLKIEEGVIEKYFGFLEGATHEIYAPYQKKEEQVLSSLATFEEKMNYKVIEDMESMGDIYNRAFPALLNIAQNHPGENLFITTHAGLMKSLFMHSAAFEKHVDVGYHSFTAGNASVLAFEWDGQTLHLIAIHGITYRK